MKFRAMANVVLSASMRKVEHQKYVSETESSKFLPRRNTTMMAN